MSSSSCLCACLWQALLQPGRMTLEHEFTFTVCKGSSDAFAQPHTHLMKSSQLLGCISKVVTFSHVWHCKAARLAITPTWIPERPLKLLLAALLSAGPDGFIPSATNLAPGSRSCPLAWSTSRMLSVRRSPAMATTLTQTSCPRLTTSRAAAGLCACTKTGSQTVSCMVT